MYCVQVVNGYKDKKSSSSNNNSNNSQIVSFLFFCCYTAWEDANNSLLLVQFSGSKLSILLLFRSSFRCEFRFRFLSMKRSSNKNGKFHPKYEFPSSQIRYYLSQFLLSMMPYPNLSFSISYRVSHFVISIHIHMYTAHTHSHIHTHKKNVQ